MFPAVIYRFNEPAYHYFDNQKPDFDALIRGTAIATTGHQSNETIPKDSVECSPSVTSVDAYPCDHSSSSHDEGPTYLDHDLCEARNTFLGVISLEDFIDTLECEHGALTTKDNILEAFATLAAQEKQSMGFPVSHSVVAKDLAFPLIQRRIKLGSISLHRFMQHIPFDGDETSVLNVVDAFYTCAANDRLGPSAKMLTVLELQTQLDAN